MRLHDYQRQAVGFVLDHPEAALLLEMGLGKTAIALHAIHELVLDRFEVSRVLVIAPKRVARDTWADELAKWAGQLGGLDIAVAVGSHAQRAAAVASRALVTTINRENLPWLVKHLGESWDFDMVVLDESSSFKNHQSQRFRAIKAVRPKIKRILALTGTPAANGLLDLWAQFRLIDQGQRLGKFITHYREALFTPDKRGPSQVYSWKPRDGAEDEIYRRISDITMSMRTADHLTLPEVTYATHEVHLSEAEQILYDKLKADLVLRLDEQIIDASNAAVLSGKLLQLASGSVLDEASQSASIHDRKLDALEDLIEAAVGQNVLVAYWYQADRERLLARFPQVRELSTSQDMADWNAGRIPVGLIHPASAGHGLNLQAGGHHLVWFTPTWSLELYQQTNARLHRQGQSEPVVIHHLQTAKTIDAAVLAALARKDTTQAALISAVRKELK